MASDSTADLRAALLALVVGEHLDVPIQPDEPMRKAVQRMCSAAHRALGKGCYRSAPVSGDGLAVRITRVEPVAIEPVAEPQVPVNDDAPPSPTTASLDDHALLTREQAAEYLRPWFPQGISATQLRSLCFEGNGPRGMRNGKWVLHRVSDLRAWATGRLKPIGGEERAA